MKLTRKDFMASAAAFAVSPMLVADGSQIKTPLMLDTKRMAIHDGPGIRTTFFVKGCPLRCVWCHNPESLSSKPQWARFQHLCRKCAMKVTALPTADCSSASKMLQGKMPYASEWNISLKP